MNWGNKFRLTNPGSTRNIFHSVTTFIVHCIKWMEINLSNVQLQRIDLQFKPDFCRKKMRTGVRLSNSAFSHELFINFNMFSLKSKLRSSSKLMIVTFTVQELWSFWYWKMQTTHMNKKNTVFCFCESLLLKSLSVKSIRVSLFTLYQNVHK